VHQSVGAGILDNAVLGKGDDLERDDATEFFADRKQRLDGTSSARSRPCTGAFRRGVTIKPAALMHGHRALRQHSARLLDRVFSSLMRALTRIGPSPVCSNLRTRPPPRCARPRARMLEAAGERGRDEIDAAFGVARLHPGLAVMGVVEHDDARFSAA
jgi:hypothetical protein